MVKKATAESFFGPYTETSIIVVFGTCYELPWIVGVVVVISLVRRGTRRKGDPDQVGDNFVCGGVCYFEVLF